MMFYMYILYIQIGKMVMVNPSIVHKIFTKVFILFQDEHTGNK